MDTDLCVVLENDQWQLCSERISDLVTLANDYLGYLADRNYSPQTVRTYAFALLAFCRWLSCEDIDLDAVTTEVLLDYLRACRQARIAGRPGPNVLRMDGRRADAYKPSTINLRLAALEGLFAFRCMRDPDAKNPVPKGKEARRPSAGERAGMLSHVARRPRHRSPLRLREPRTLPRSLDRHEVVALVESLRSFRDRAIAGLMVFCGLRAGEVLALEVKDVDIGGRWLRVFGKGRKERRVPLDVDVAGMIQTYLLAERPETTAKALFVVAKGPRPRPAPHAGWASNHLPLSPRQGRGPGGASPCTSPHLRHRARRSRGRPRRHAGATWPCPHRHHRPLRPSRTRTREGGVRCRARAPACASLSTRGGTSSPTT